MHVCRDHPFKNDSLFYRFIVQDKDHGHAVQGQSWSDIKDIEGKCFDT